MKKKEMERIFIDKENVDNIEEDIIIRRMIERYMYVRQFVYGHVLDIACGTGSGSYLLSKNPDVKKITGVDISETAVSNASQNFNVENIEYILGTPETINGQFDVMVSLETIEHLENPAVLRELAERCGIKEIILSFPRKKTTHYNKYHLWDITREDVVRLFQGFECYRAYDIHDCTIMNLLRADRDVHMSPRRYFNKTDIHKESSVL